MNNSPITTIALKIMEENRLHPLLEELAKASGLPAERLAKIFRLSLEAAYLKGMNDEFQRENLPTGGDEEEQCPRCNGELARCHIAPPQAHIETTWQVCTQCNWRGEPE